MGTPVHMINLTFVFTARRYASAVLG